MRKILAVVFVVSVLAIVGLFAYSYFVSPIGGYVTPFDDYDLSPFVEWEPGEDDIPVVLERSHSWLGTLEAFGIVESGYGPHADLTSVEYKIASFSVEFPEDVEFTYKPIYETLEEQPRLMLESPDITIVQERNIQTGTPDTRVTFVGGWGFGYIINYAERKMWERSSSDDPYVECTRHWAPGSDISKEKAFMIAYEAILEEEGIDLELIKRWDGVSDQIVVRCRDYGVRWHIFNIKINPELPDSLFNPEI